MDLASDDFIERLKLPVKIAAKSPFKPIFEHRLRIYKKFQRLVETAKSDGEFEARRIDDFELFALTSYDVQYKVGHKRFLAAPIYVSPSQSRLSDLVDTKDTTYAVFNRQTGKTTFAGLKGAQLFLQPRSTQNFFAPSKEQLEMFDKVKEILNTPHYKDNYIQDGVNRSTEITSPVLGSKVEQKTLGVRSQTGGGEKHFKRGSSGIVWVDEYELLDEVTKKEILGPIKASPDADTTAVYTMTPKISFDPNLDQEIQAAILDPNVGYHHTHMFASMFELRTGREYIADRFGDGPDGLHISCPYGRQGHCPKYYRELYEEDPELWSAFKRWDDFECNEVCKNSDTLLQEDWAEFPDMGGRYFPLDALRDTADPYYFKHYSEINSRAKHIVSCDWGLVDDPMVIQVWEQLKPGHAQLIFWEKSQKGAHLEDEQLDLLKKRFTQYKGDALYMDVTKDDTFLQRNLTRPSTANERYRIPAGKVWANETASKHDMFGIIVKGPFKSEMYRIWRGQLMGRHIVVPDMRHEPEFWDDWWGDHFSVKAEPAHEGQYYRFGRTGHTIDAAAMAGLGISGRGVRKVWVGVG